MENSTPTLEGSENPFLVPAGAVEASNPFMVPATEGQAPTEQQNPFLTPAGEQAGEAPVVSVNVHPDAALAIMQNPEAKAVIEQLQAQWGDAAPVFAPGDERQGIWDEYSKEATAANPSKTQQATNRLIPGDAQNAVLAGVRNGAVNAATLAGELATGVGLPALGEPIKNLAGMVPQIGVDKTDPEQAISEELSRFLLGGGVATNLAKGAFKKELTASLVGGAAGDMAVSSIEDKRLMQSLVEEFPFLDTPVTHYLAADDSSDVEARFKQALEGMLLSSTAHGVFTMAKYLKGRIGESMGKKMVTEPVTEEQLTEALNGTKAGERTTTQAVESMPPADAAEPLRAAPEAPPEVASEAAKAADEVAPPSQVFDTLPRDLAGAKPRYNYGNKGFDLEFESDIEKALFVTSQKKASKRDADYRAWLQGQGYTDAQINEYGQRVRSHLKAEAKGSEEGVLQVGKLFERPQGAKGVTPKAEPGATPEAPVEGAPVTPEASGGRLGSAVEIDPAKREMYYARMKQMFDANGDFSGDASDLISGLFNANTMTSSDEVKRSLTFLEQMAGDSVNKITGGVQSLATTEKMASKLVAEVADMAGAKRTSEVLGPLSDLAGDTKKMAARLVAGKQMMQWAADKVYRLSQVVDQRGGAAAEAEFLQAVDVLREITGVVKGAQTAAARMTSAGRIKTGVAGDLNMSPEELLQVVDGAGGSEMVGVLARRVRTAGLNGKPKDIVKVLHQSTLGRVIDVHNELWINSILGGVKTNVVNMTSNMGNTLLRPGEKWIGGQLMDKTGKAMSAIGEATGNDKWVSGGKKLSQEGQAAYAEASSMYAYMRMGLMDTFNLAGKAGEMDIYGSGKSAFKAFKEEANILDPAMKTNEFQNFAIQMGDGSVMNAWERATQGDLKASMEMVVNGMGQAIRLPSRFLMAEDEFFKQLNARAHLFGQANREATLRGFKQGSDEYTSFVEDFFGKAFDPDTGRLLDDRAKQWSRESTFTQDLKTDTWLGGKSFSESMSSLASSQPLLRGTVLPFIRTPANLMRNLWDHTPVFGQLRKQFWTDISKGTPEQKAMAIGKLTTGTAMWSGAAMLAAEGHITGGGPQGDPSLMAEMRATGWEPYSIKCKDGWIPMSRLDPFGSILAMAADFVEMSGRISQEEHDELALNMSVGLGDHLGKYGAAAGTTFVNNIANKSYLKGLTDTLSMLARNSGSMTKEEMLKQTIYQRVASYIPAYTQVLSQDDQMKEVRSLVDAMRSRIPGLSASLPPKRDELGDVVTRDGAFIGGVVHSSAVWPFAKSDYKNDPVRDEIARLGSQLGVPVFPRLPKKEGPLDYTEIKNSQTGQTVYDRMTELMGSVTDGRGNTLKDALASTIAKESYNRSGEGNATLPYSRKLEMLREVRSRYEDKAWRELKKEPGFESFVASQKAMSRNKRSVSFHGLDALVQLPNRP